MLTTTSLRNILLAAVLAVTASTCAILSAPDMPPITIKAPVAQGASHCAVSDDGKMVACGGAAPFCQVSSDGKMVACGGLAPFCQHSSDGKQVACGGKAPFCEKSHDGKMVACGGA
jgi:hypothetical protein